MRLDQQPVLRHGIADFYCPTRTMTSISVDGEACAACSAPPSAPGAVCGDDFYRRLAKVRKLERGPKPVLALTAKIGLKGRPVALEEPTREGVIKTLEAGDFWAVGAFAVKLYATEPKSAVGGFASPVWRPMYSYVAPYVLLAMDVGRCARGRSWFKRDSGRATGCGGFHPVQTQYAVSVPDWPPKTVRQARR